MYSKSLVLTVVAMSLIATNYQSALAVGSAALSSEIPARTNRPGSIRQAGPKAIVPSRTSQESNREGVIEPSSSDTSSTQKITVDGKDSSKVQLDVTISKNKMGDYEAVYSYNPEDFGASVAGCSTGECKVTDTVTFRDQNTLNKLNQEIAKRIGTKPPTNADSTKITLTKEEKKEKRQAKLFENCDLEEKVIDEETKEKMDKRTLEAETRICVKDRYDELLSEYKNSGGTDKTKAEAKLMAFLESNQDRLSSWVAGGGKNAEVAGKLLNSMLKSAGKNPALSEYAIETFSSSVTTLQASYSQMNQNALANAPTNPQVAQIQFKIAANTKARLSQLQGYASSAYNQLLMNQQAKVMSSSGDEDSQMQQALDLSDFADKFRNSALSVLPQTYNARLESNALCYQIRLTSGQCATPEVDLVTGNSVTLSNTQAVGANGANLGTDRSNRFGGTGYAGMFDGTTGVPSPFMVDSNGQQIQALPGTSSLPQLQNPNIGGNTAVIPQGPGRSGRTG